MLKLLSLLFPVVKDLIELNETRKKVIDNINTKKEYVVLEPIDIDSPHFINSIGGLWNDSNSIKWFMHSIRQTVFAKMLKEDDSKYRNQIIGIELVIKAFEEYKKKYEQLQILQTEGSEQITR